MERLFLLDGSAIAYRSHFAFGANPLVNKAGMETSACYGFLNQILRILKDEKPSRLAVVFDAPGPTFRHKMFEDYKATREKMPDELKAQLPYIQQMVEAMNIPYIAKEGFEADDIIGTLAYRAQAQDMEVYMVTGDKDFMQLLKPNIYMYSLKKRDALDIINASGPEKKWGVPVERVVDMLALMGDSSDNIPGVPGIGEKTATKLIQNYGSMDDMYNNLDRIEPERIRKKLIEYKDQAYLCRDLVTIDVDTPVEVDMESLRLEEPNLEDLLPILEELEFHSLIKKIKPGLKAMIDPEKAKPSSAHSKNITPKSSTKASTKRAYKRIETEKELDQLIHKLQKSTAFVLDTETTSLHPLDAKIIGMSFAHESGQAHYLSFQHMQLSPQEVWKKLTPLLENPDVRKGGQNIKYDRHVLRNEGINLQGIGIDTMIASYLLDPNSHRHGIDALAQTHLNMEKIPTQDLIGKGSKQISMLEVPIEQITEYACEDADVAFQLHQHFDPQLKQHELMDLYLNLELPLLEVLGDMEREGIYIDADILARQGQDIAKMITELEKTVFDIAGETFNLNSPKQLGPILFEKLKIQNDVGIKKVKTTKTGYATNQETLEKYSAHPIIASILQYRNLAKLKSTYLDALPSLIHPKTKRVHTSFNQTVAATGRLSSSDPNLQNIPIRSVEGRKIREAFVAQNKGWKIVSADYSQIELRLLAHMSQDPILLKSFQNDEDVHRRTAATMFGVEMDQVTAEQRGRAKTINFGIIYGMGPQRLARENQISVDQAKEFIAAYFKNYSHVQNYFDDTLAFARQHGFVQTLMGRRRPVPEIHAKNKRFASLAERIAINTPLQGTAADLIKKAMLNIAKQLQDAKWQSKMLIQVHDELIFEAPESELDALTAMVKKQMGQAMSLDVPLKVDVGIGDSWAEAH
jgi:DNA polymerase-1